MAPIVACTTLGLYMSTVSVEARILSIPNQSAIRMMVPKLPGSRMESRARKSPLSLIRKGCSLGFWTIASTGEGEVSIVILDIVLLPISSSR